METFKSPTTMKNCNHILTPANLSQLNSCIRIYHNAMHIKKMVLHFPDLLTHTLANCCICTLPVQESWPCHTTGLIKHQPHLQKTTVRRSKLRRTNIILYSQAAALSPNSRADTFFVICNTSVLARLIKARHISYFDSIKCTK
jgi:hypothetical protein